MPDLFVKNLIIGAGPTGLGAAYRLNELGIKDYLVIDSASEVGGLAKSFRDDRGFTWDVGGHVQFSHYQYFDELMDRALGREGWLEHQRESWIWMRDRFIPYPLQNNIRHLPKDEMWQCLQGLIEVSRNFGRQQPKNFRDWILATFGQGLADTFMIPYNFKVWAYPADEMSHGWIGERVAVTDLQRVIKNIVESKDDLSWGPNQVFRFPKKGGTGAVWKAVADLSGRERIKLQIGLKTIFPKEKIAVLTDGTRVCYEYLLSTIPIVELVRRIDGIDEKTRSLASRIKFSASNIVGIGLQGKPPKSLESKCWIYFPESDCPFYRVTVFSNYSPANVPDPSRHWSLMTEVSESPHKPVNQLELMESVVRGLQMTKLIDPGSEIISRWSYRAEYGYPTPSIERDSLVAEINGKLEAFNIFSRGRFGSHKYEISNQDHSLMQGVEWVNRMIHRIPETTYYYPGTVNSGWGFRV